MSDDVNICFVGSALDSAPAIVHVAVAECNDGHTIAMSPSYPFKGRWGESNSIIVPETECKSIPTHYCIIYLSLVEAQYYIADVTIPGDILRQISDIASFDKIIVGMGPSGRVAIWLHGRHRQKRLLYHKADEISCSELGITDQEIIHYQHEYATECCPILGHNIDKLMSIYTYRYVINFKMKNPEDVKALQYKLNEVLFDGTFDKTNNEKLLLYHEGGIPEKLSIDWKDYKTCYSIYLWFDNQGLTKIFDQFYGIHHNTRTDLIINIDAENKKYELALFRQGLKEPLIIPEAAYQLIVFKNNFEDYRSENYNQPRGAWIW